MYLDKTVLMTTIEPDIDVWPLSDSEAFGTFCPRTIEVDIAGVSCAICFPRITLIVMTSGCNWPGDDDSES